MRILVKLLALAAAIGFAPAAVAQGAPQPPAGSAAQAATGGQEGNRAAPAEGRTALPSPAITGGPTAAATDSTAATPGGPTPPSVTPAGNTPWSSSLTPAADVGQPQEGRVGLQDQYSPIGREAAGFHDWILMPAILLITLFVLGLLVYVILRYRRAAHPVPSRTTHNTTVEVIWTLVPVLILVAIAVPSLTLLSHQYSPPPADLTIKAIGNRWYWVYEYPDNGLTAAEGKAITSNMLPERDEAQAGAQYRTEADGPRQLAVDQRMVVPVGRTVKIITTSADVIHSFGIPAFWVKMDAVPGRLNETWFTAERPGIYFGACYELCGSRHGFMPIAVEAVSDEDFARWVASKGGHPAGAAPAAPAAPAAASANATGGASEGSPAPTNQVQAVGNAAPVDARSTEPR